MVYDQVFLNELKDYCYAQFDDRGEEFLEELFQQCYVFSTDNDTDEEFYHNWSYEFVEKFMDDEHLNCIVKFSKNDDVIYVRFSADHDSWEGAEFDRINIDNAKLVRPKEVKKIVYKDIDCDN